MKPEIWKPIPGYLNIKVSNFGRVKSLDRLDALGRMRKGRVLKQFKSNAGYFQVHLCEDGKKKTRDVHRIVMETFVGPCPKGLVVNHIDEDKTNNRLDNLEYVTHRQNVNHGTGIERGHSKRVRQLTIDGDIIAEYSSMAEAQRKTGASPANICWCCKGYWKTSKGYRWEYV